MEENWVQFREKWQADFLKTLLPDPELVRIRKLGQSWMKPYQAPGYVLDYLGIKSRKDKRPLSIHSWSELIEYGMRPNGLFTFEYKSSHTPDELRKDPPQPLEPTPRQEKVLVSLERKISALDSQYQGESMSIDEFFDWCDQEGDFHYPAEWDGVDEHVYQCGKKDCDIQWHKISYALEMGRKDGKRWVILRSCDSDGDHDISDSYDEREGDGPEAWENLSKLISRQSFDYFSGWATYWVECAWSGKDPVGNFYAPEKINPRHWVGKCINLAKEAIKNIVTTQLTRHPHSRPLRPGISKGGYTWRSLFPRTEISRAGASLW